MREFDRAACPDCHVEYRVNGRGELWAHGCGGRGRRTGRPTTSVLERVRRHVRRTRGGHLRWTGGKIDARLRQPAMRVGPRKPNGARRASVYPRRVLWEEKNGPLPAGGRLYVTCSVGAYCVEPDHMELRVPRDTPTEPALP